MWQYGHNEVSTGNFDTTRFIILKIPFNVNLGEN